MYNNKMSNFKFTNIFIHSTAINVGNIKTLVPQQKD